MFRKFNIGPRLLTLISVQGAILLLIGVMTLAVLEFARNTTRGLNEKVSQQAVLIALSENVRSDLIGTVHQLNVGSMTWPEAKGALTIARDDFELGWSHFVNGLDADDQEFVDDVLAPYVDGVREAFDLLAPIVDTQNRSRLSLFSSNDLEFLVGPFLNALVASTSLQQIEAESAVNAAAAAGQKFFYGSAATIIFGLLVAAALGFAIFRSITSPLGAIASTVQSISAGDFSARTEVAGSDELGQLGQAFDSMLNERVATLTRAQSENEQLNESVISLLEAVAQLAQKDLRVKVPVTEDVTGPVADSLNLLTTETANVLSGVRAVSGLVATASQQVKAQSDAVIDLATHERVEVAETAQALSNASENMTRIAKLAHACAVAADKAINSTQTAMETVTGTVNGINGIRETIRETEKRIKRLGERSQEITAVVGIINTIAERTHILALNASMHAASAGDAGRGFAVVADEVQRLAENARDATAQISTLVTNIQTETADTVTTMNHAITQVVDGSALAERAGLQMEATRDSTAELVDMVQRIARGSAVQARTSLKLQRRAEGIRQSTEDTSAQLKQQSTHTDALVAHSHRLIDAVSVFVLPETSNAGTASNPDAADAAPAHG